ncbi:hypothetical protein KGF56_003741 [Candida oxycetoniae]|uniref:Uncharacterized protein n=1 Tax=Candida oxycetoniae TaxID=497107 RepID=A0AAI9WWR1_9ASCO|nr:uncharacterized protein KGF56_003741 [Candida oxycetoniae]KAI3403457.1 hypothetical protein KGF56_003741 [Candida oxycetoniae]
MFRKLSTGIISKRCLHGTTRKFAGAEAFSNKFNFNLNPPQVHEYWNIYNSSVLFAFVPVFLGIAYVAKYVGVNLEGNAGFLQYANSESSPLKSIKFGETQKRKPLDE